MKRTPPSAEGPSLARSGSGEFGNDTVNRILSETAHPTVELTPHERELVCWRLQKVRDRFPELKELQSRTTERRLRKELQRLERQLGKSRDTLRGLAEDPSLLAVLAGPWQDEPNDDAEIAELRKRLDRISPNAKLFSAKQVLQTNPEEASVRVELTQWDGVTSSLLERIQAYLNRPPNNYAFLEDLSTRSPSTNRFGRSSPEAVIIWFDLKVLYEQTFHEKVGVSHSDEFDGGPAVRFITSALRELEIANKRGRPFKHSDVVQVLRWNRRATKHRKPDA